MSGKTLHIQQELLPPFFFSFGCKESCFCNKKFLLTPPIFLDYETKVFDICYRLILLKLFFVLFTVAPYEADAQLAFLNQSGLAQVVITEDSDLVVFGCKAVSNLAILNLDSLFHTSRIFSHINVNLLMCIAKLFAGERPFQSHFET